jgi:hypothetical protein
MHQSRSAQSGVRLQPPQIKLIQRNASAQSLNKKKSQPTLAPLKERYGADITESWQRGPIDIPKVSLYFPATTH